MKIATEFNYNKYSIKNNIQLFTIGIGFSVVFILSFSFDITVENSLLFLALSGCLALMFSIHTIYSLFLILVFVPLQGVFHVSVLFGIVVLISFLVCYPNIQVKDFSNPFQKAIIIYILSVIPSLYNSISPLMSVAMFFNFISMLLIMLITKIAMDSRKRMMNVVYLYLTGVLINSVYVIYEGVLTGKRTWGFSGIFYVDFVGLATLISLILFIYSSKTKKMFFGLLTVISIIGLILTQTRNAWLSAAISILLLLIFLIKNAKKYKISSKSLILVLFLLVGVSIISYFGASTFSTKLDERLSEKSQTTVLDDDPYSAGENSFVTRAFIWHTAVMAFLEHPIIGIGTYSFPFSSQIYYKIPKSFYEIFVKGRTPHVTYLAVLTETGIIGFLGFIFFLFIVSKTVLGNLSVIISRGDIASKLLINWGFVYILISMLMTDAWLWGQQAMILGIFLGLILADYNFTKIEKS